MNCGNFCSALTQARTMNASGVSLTPALSALRLESLAHLLELGDVGLVELRDVRQIDPARVQPRPGDALHATRAA